METAHPETSTKDQPTVLLPSPSPEPTKRISFFPNQAYIPNGSKEQILDIYLPKTGDDPFPTILAFHGGAFRSGSGYPTKSMYRKFAYHYNDLGYALVSVDYRLAPTYSYPAQVEDVFCALAWVHANHETYSLD